MILEITAITSGHTIQWKEAIIQYGIRMEEMLLVSTPQFMTLIVNCLHHHYPQAHIVLLQVMGQSSFHIVTGEGGITQRYLEM
ncbi:MAG: hypothetical protein A3205_04450 [Methanomassiliicoccales archaeon Mx-03]|nr:MAG: hypothetical protein A3205_04450 [Methanomassiliicoccales archaeon Mx-03]